eukprot:scpid105319/ scgid28559/ 
MTSKHTQLPDEFRISNYALDWHACMHASPSGLLCMHHPLDCYACITLWTSIHTSCTGLAYMCYPQDYHACTFELNKVSSIGLACMYHALDWHACDLATENEHSLRSVPRLS